MNWKKDQFSWLSEGLYNRYSQFGEDSIIEKIFSRIGTANKWVMECGAADGIFFSNSRKLIEQGWSAVLIEGDGGQYEKLTSLYQGNDHVSCWNYFVDTQKNTFDKILSHKGAPTDIDLAVIDVDGQDYWLFNSLLKYKPRVVICEYDPNADPDFIPPLDGEGQAGRNAIIRLGVGKHYYPVCATWCNVIFVRQELVSMVAASPEEWKRFGDTMEAQVNGWAKLINDADSYDYPAKGRSGDTAEIAQAAWNDGMPKCSYCELKAVHIVNGEAAYCLDHYRTRQPAPKLAAVTSIPQLGHNVNFGCQLEALSPFGIGIRQCYGAFWHQALSEGIGEVLKQGADYVLTMDYDVLFTSKHVADLMALALENPDVDVIIPCLAKREGNGLCAHTKEQDAEKGGVNLNDPLIPIQLGHFGLTLFKASVFDRLHRPWFQATPDDSGGWGEGHIDADMNFWLNCEASGIKVMLARHVRVGHIEYMATIPNAEDPRKTDYVHVGEWRKWAVKENEAVNERLRIAKESYARTEN